MKELNHNKLKLKPVTHSDANNLFIIIDECREYLRPWLYWVDSTKDPKDIHDFIDNIENEVEHPFCIFYDQKLAGLISLKDYDELNYSGEIGYWLAEKYQDKGIMYNACKLLVKHLFEEINLKRIEIGIAVDNIKSKKIPQKLGFLKEGIRKCASYINNDFQDYEIYSYINENWRPTKK